MTRLYGTNEWQEDLKNILGRAVSSLDQHVVFLFNDSEVNCVYLFICIVHMKTAIHKTYYYNNNWSNW